MSMSANTFPTAEQIGRRMTEQEQRARAELEANARRALHAKYLCLYGELFNFMRKQQGRVMVKKGAKFSAVKSDVYFVPLPEDFWVPFAKDMAKWFSSVLEDAANMANDYNSLSANDLATISVFIGQLKAWERLDDEQTMVLFSDIMSNFRRVYSKSFYYDQALSRFIGLFGSISRKDRFGQGYIPLGLDIVRSLPLNVTTFASLDPDEWQIYLPIMDMDSDTVFLAGSSTDTYKVLRKHALDGFGEDAVEVANRANYISIPKGHFALVKTSALRKRGDVAVLPKKVKRIGGGVGTLLSTKYNNSGELGGISGIYEVSNSSLIVENFVMDQARKLTVRARNPAKKRSAGSIREESSTEEMDMSPPGKRRRRLPPSREEFAPVSQSGKRRPRLPLHREETAPQRPSSSSRSRKQSTVVSPPSPAETSPQRPSSSSRSRKQSTAVSPPSPKRKTFKKTPSGSRTSKQSSRASTISSSRSPVISAKSIPKRRSSIQSPNISPKSSKVSNRKKMEESEEEYGGYESLRNLSSPSSKDLRKDSPPKVEESLLGITQDDEYDEYDDEVSGSASGSEATNFEASLED